MKNEIKLSEEDVNIVNEKGNKVYFIKAPGNYSLHFKNIKVLNDFGYLSGEIGVTLQVPLLEGPAGKNFSLTFKFYSFCSFFFSCLFVTEMIQHFTNCSCYYKLD